MLKYDKLFKLLAEHGYNTTRIRNEKIIGQSTLYSLKNGTKGIDSKTIDKFCKLFNCQPSDIMEYVPDENVNNISVSIHENNNNVQSVLSENESELLELFRKFNSREQLKIIVRIEDIYDRKISACNNSSDTAVMIARNKSQTEPKKRISGDFSDILNAPDSTGKY